MANEWGGLTAITGTPVPDFFADEAVGFDMLNGTLRITFGVVVPTEPAAPSPVAMANIGRLILPIESAQRLAVSLHDYLVQRGLNPSAVAGASESEIPN
jgi:hypothetical protein